MLSCQDHKFQLPTGLHYLNCAYKSPLLRTAEEAAVRALHRERNPAEISVGDFFNDLSEVKQLFGSMVNCAPSQVALIPSYSYGIASALNNIPANGRNKVLSVQDEFPSTYYALSRWCDQHRGEQVRVAPGPDADNRGATWNQRILESIDAQTAVVVLSSVHWMSGTKFDLKAIGARCREVGARFIVDGSQSVGVAPIDVNEYQIDALICAGYKWLFGPYSTGIAYYGESFNTGTPIEESWMNRINAEDFGKLTEYTEQYAADAGRYSVGEASNFILLPMLKAGLSQLNEWTAPAIQAYCKDLGRPLVDALNEQGLLQDERAYMSDHLFALHLPKHFDPLELKEVLEERNIYVSLRGNSIRVSLNVFNTADSVAALSATISSFLKTGK